LASYLLGEQICGALSGVAKLSPELILTDCEVALHARSRFAVPMALVQADERIEISGELPRSAGASRPIVAGFFTIGHNRFRLPDGHESEQRTVEEAVALLAQRVELLEPFGRIREAISEAQRVGGRGTDANDQAA
jgi:hypothetical protein